MSIFMDIWLWTLKKAYFSQKLRTFFTATKVAWIITYIWLWACLPYSGCDIDLNSHLATQMKSDHSIMEHLGDLLETSNATWTLALHLKTFNIKQQFQTILNMMLDFKSWITNLNLKLNSLQICENPERYQQFLK